MQDVLVVAFLQMVGFEVVSGVGEYERSRVWCGVVVGKGLIC